MPRGMEDFVIEGVLDVDYPGNGLVSTPITCHLEKGVITAIEGGADANAWRSSLESAESNLHAPNENVRLEDYFQGIRFVGELIRRFAAG